MKHMAVLRVSKKRMILIGVCCLLIAAFLLPVGNPIAVQVLQAEKDVQWETVLQRFFDLRNDAVLKGDTETLRTLFFTEERNGRWAYENELVRADYLSDWAAKQGVTVLNIRSDLSLRSVKQVGRGYAFYVIASTAYEYSYPSSPDYVNTFRLGGYHSIDMIPGEDGEDWIVSREWYDDPLADAFDARGVTPEMTEMIAGHPGAEIADLGERRLSAVAYADTYCGAASGGANNYQYNSAYNNYNALGGDCANFASQVLYEGGGFKKSTVWNYRAGKGSRAWLNAQAFRNYLAYSGRGTQLAKGKYADVVEAAYSLLPGDIIAYAKKGKVTHIAVVTGLDEAGYPLVSCHNADRNRVPFDIGWDYSATTFILIRVNYS